MNRNIVANKMWISEHASTNQMSVKVIWLGGLEKSTWNNKSCWLKKSLSQKPFFLTECLPENIPEGQSIIVNTNWPFWCIDRKKAYLKNVFSLVRKKLNQIFF